MRILERVSTWIAILLFLLIASMLSAFLYDFYTIITTSTRTATEDHLMQNTRTNATMIREKVQGDLDTIYALANLISNYESIDTPEARAMLKRMGNEFPFSIIVVSDRNGNYYTNTGSEINLKNPEYLHGASKLEHSISVVYKEALYGRDMIALESAVYHSGIVDGTVSGLYYENYIINILAAAENESIHQYQVVDSSGNFILSSGMSEFYKDKNLYNFLAKNGFDEEARKQVIHDFISGRQGVVSFSPNKENRYFCYTPIGINDWYLISQLPEQSINLDAFSMSNPTIVLAFRIVILFVILFLFIAYKTIRFSTSMQNSRIELEHLNQRLQAKNETLKVKAENDLLTELYNKVTSELVITDFLQNEGKDGKHALFVLDLDNFKSINDELGHFYGDKALTEVADGINHCLRTTDIKGRIGGDKFIVLLKNIKSDADVIQKANEIRTKLNGIRLLFDTSWTISASIGISIYPDHANEFTDLFRKADKAMYVSKEHGKGTYRIYHRDIEN